MRLQGITGEVVFIISDLLTAMSADMKISRFRNETEDSFIYRLCYSALGQWCLNLGRNRIGNIIGTTKHNQTIVLNDLMRRYSELFPNIAAWFIDTNAQPINFPVFIRRVYEETGYLLTDENNHNRLANFGRCIRMGDQLLFFGLPTKISAINGLGVFSESTGYEVSVREFLIRDCLTCEEYFHARFDLIDFYEQDIDIQGLEFFNPMSDSSPSRSWHRKLETDCSVARRYETGPFYRVMKTSGGIKFADEPVEAQDDAFDSYEYRRLYFSMKHHYKHPVKVWITEIDEEYSKIQIGGHLPNREYYFLLLLSWPEHSAFDKVNFIIKNYLLDEIITTFTNLGINIIRRTPS